ncbi:efflux RND transporter periplasmic adaptor subunit [Oleiagrimonas sp. C23AA]|uniref:efflux RND transporter periplasmic adaptor subunit n=1 Tax=Oleiagrimonas sp. C23AA TaxID=2719047 RepID=UPI00141DFF1F|nr:efflux RND transporter periplasmic adaptor subunit [Oleiagrimonas sp. C23AA]NII11373.1 efflux RND transporter periplasmic adaptor subunit [Oleiagrimonas sp. C23AA]
MRSFMLAGLLLVCAGIATAAESSLKLSSAQRQALGIRVGAITSANQVPVDGLPAMARAPLHESAVVTAPFAGITVAVLAREGNTVKRGQALARIQSREAMTLGAQLAAASGDYRVARAQADRDQQMLDEGIIPASRVQTVIARRDAAAARLSELQAARAMAPQAAGAAAGTYELRAPLDGRVIERSLRLGEPVAALAKAFVVAQPDKVMLEIQVPARYAGQLRPGLTVRAGAGEGVVSEVGAAVDRASQTLLVRADMRGQQLLPGQQTSATLQLPAPQDAWTLPSSAIAEHAGQHVVFVERDAGYLRVAVKVLAQTGDGQSVVQGPLNKGSQVVVAGAGALKAMLLAGE